MNVTKDRIKRTSFFVTTHMNEITVCTDYLALSQIVIKREKKGVRRKGSRSSREKEL